MAMPNWSFNRSANGMAPCPRGSACRSLPHRPYLPPRGNAPTPSSPGQLCVRQRKRAIP
jgi:hypothetical protein